jgi:hypothetical protein
MWKDLRSRLEGWGLLAPLSDQLTLRGRVHAGLPNGLPATTDAGTLLSVTIGDGKRTLLELGADGHFRLELPLHQVVRLTIARQGHLPRMVEVQPLRSAFRFARDPVHVRCEIDVALTPRHDLNGAAMRPLMERITMPKDDRPLIAEWDYVMRAEHHEEFVPLFTRVV